MTYNMTIEQIKSSLARFYEGQTTPEEERLLADFFRREDVPEDLQEDKQLFLMLAQISDQEMPQDIAEEITAFVENIVRVERDKNNLGQTEKKPVLSEVKHHKGIIYCLKTPPKDKEFNVPEVGTSVTRAPHLLRPQATGFRSVRLNRFWYRVAATVAILIALGGGMFVHQQRTFATDPFRDTCSTPEEAAMELLKANAMIAKASQQCLAPTRDAFERIDDTKEMINKRITF